MFNGSISTYNSKVTVNPRFAGGGGGALNAPTFSAKL